MAELVDALVLGTSVHDVKVRVLSSALFGRSNSIGRAPAFQAGSCEFESRLLLNFTGDYERAAENPRLHKTTVLSPPLPP